ncbi:SOS response-associated peptidase [Roseivirga pacifica]|uniref:SOS response-associated peptidase n=1 Tax=Roseivirga pacifica TaxID=1267423 RepID=UPI003BAEF2F3
MLTNFSIATDPQKIAKQFSVELPENYQPTYNANPTQKLPIITSANPEKIELVHWGSTEAFSKSKSVSGKLLFAPAEEIQTKSSLKKNFSNRRCVILADSFYAWKEIAKKEKVPYRFYIGENNLFAIAGLWDSFEDEDGAVVNTFMMITTAANNTVSEVSERMPAILNEDLLIEWLNEDTKDDSLLEFIKPYQPNDLDKYTINPKLADPNFNDSKLWERVPPANQFGNLTLFN